jgi:hypothetical protein
MAFHRKKIEFPDGMSHCRLLLGSPAVAGRAKVISEK